MFQDMSLSTNLITEFGNYCKENNYNNTSNIQIMNEACVYRFSVSEFFVYGSDFKYMATQRSTKI